MRTTKQAAKKAMELLSAKELADGQQYFGLYLQQLQQRLKGLHRAEYADDRRRPDQERQGYDLLDAGHGPKGIKLDMKDLKQQAAMPLASFLRFDPWTDQVVQMHTSFEPIINERDKMPFEVEPVYLKLTYYTPLRPAAGAAAAAAAPAAARPLHRCCSGDRCPAPAGNRSSSAGSAAAVTSKLTSRSRVQAAASSLRGARTETVKNAASSCYSSQEMECLRP